MAKLLKLRRGTTSQHSSFTGAEGEVTVDTTKDTVVVHDGSTAGGHALAKETTVNAKANLASPTFTGDVTLTGASHNVLFDASDNALEFADDAKLKLGAGDDLVIYSDGTNGTIHVPHSGGSLRLGTTTNTTSFTLNATSIGFNVSTIFDADVTFQGAANNIVFDESDNAIEFSDDAKAIFGTGGDFELFHDGSHNILLGVNGADFKIKDASNNSAIFDTSAGIELFYANSKKLEITSTGVDVTGTATLDGITIDGAYEQVSEAVSALDIDCSTGNYFTKTISGNSTFTFSNPAASGSVTSFTLELTHSSGTVTWPASVKWNADTAPTLTTGKTHLFMFVTDDGGSRYRGSALVDYVN